MTSTNKLDAGVGRWFGQWWRHLLLCYRFKYVLPKIDVAVIDGVRLDLTPHSPRVRNRILSGYEETEKKLCKKFLNADDSVLEIGGAIGFIGLFCQKRIGIRNYITVEANPMTVECLKRNYELNDLVPKILTVALGRTEGMVQFHTGTDFWAQHVIDSTTRAKSDMVNVPSVPLRKLLEMADNKVNTLIIDIEGGERFIDFNTLNDHVQKIIIELHPRMIGRRTARKILRALTEKGFRIAHESEDTFALLRDDKTKKAF